MYGSEEVSFLFAFMLIGCVGAVGALFTRGRANPGNVLILLLLPFLFLFVAPLLEGREMPRGLEDVSSKVIVSVIGGLIAGVILLAITRK